VAKHCSTTRRSTSPAWLNDVLKVETISGFCGTCHDTPDVGNHSVKLPINIGIANGGPNNDNPVLDIADLQQGSLQR
jgi:cytochrome c peroxidase